MKKLFISLSIIIFSAFNTFANEYELGFFSAYVPVLSESEFENSDVTLLYIKYNTKENKFYIYDDYYPEYSSVIMTLSENDLQKLKTVIETLISEVDLYKKNGKTYVKEINGSLIKTNAEFYKNDICTDSKKIDINFFSVMLGEPLNILKMDCVGLRPYFVAIDEISELLSILSKEKILQFKENCHKKDNEKDNNSEYNVKYDGDAAILYETEINTILGKKIKFAVVFSNSIGYFMTILNDKCQLNALLSEDNINILRENLKRFKEPSDDKYHHSIISANYIIYEKDFYKMETNLNKPELMNKGTYIHFSKNDDKREFIISIGIMPEYLLDYIPMYLYLSESEAYRLLNCISIDEINKAKTNIEKYKRIHSNPIF